MKPSRIYFLLASALSASLLSAAPIIHFDTKIFNFGTIIEGKSEIVKTVFIVKNTGDAVLKLESVRPSCGCVLARYDSAIAPGATGQIESFMNTKGFRSGTVTKWIAISSNAKKRTIGPIDP